MNRIFKRPMFRKGGTPNEGIMSGLKENKDRQRYETGGLSEVLKGQRRKQQILSLPIIAKTPADFEREYQSFLRGYEPDVLVGVDEFGPGTFGEVYETLPETAAYKAVASPETKKAFIQERLDEQKALIEEAKQLGATSAELPELDLPKVEDPKDDDPDDKLDDKSKGEPRVTPKSDTETIKDYMDMFKTALAEDPDAVRRQKYLQLAQFGTSLLAQPGGDLTAAIGKAAAPALAGLGKIQEREQDIATKAKLLGVEAAMKKGQLAQNIQDLVDLGYSREEAIKKIVEEGSGSATRQATEQRAREKLTDDISTTHGIPSATASRISGKIFASRIPDYFYELIPTNPTQEDVGKYFYDKKGNIGKLVVKDGKFGLDDGKK